MDGLTLLDRARVAGLAVESDGDRLIIRGPRQAGAIARELIERKAEILAALAAPVAPTWEELREQRWGPSLEHDEPGIDVLCDWRSQVAALPHDRWLAWRRRSGEIRAADRHAADLVLAADGATGRSGAMPMRLRSGPCLICGAADHVVWRNARNPRDIVRTCACLAIIDSSVTLVPADWGDMPMQAMSN